MTPTPEQIEDLEAAEALLKAVAAMTPEELRAFRAGPTWVSPNGTMTVKPASLQ